MYNAHSKLHIFFLYSWIWDMCSLYFWNWFTMKCSLVSYWFFVACSNTWIISWNEIRNAILPISSSTNWMQWIKLQHVALNIPQSFDSNNNNIKQQLLMSNMRMKPSWLGKVFSSFPQSQQVNIRIEHWKSFMTTTLPIRYFVLSKVNVFAPKQGYGR